jgi:hypothetical protein
MERFEREHPDLKPTVKDWREAHPAGTLKDAVRDLDLWPDPGDKDVQWYVWRALYELEDPVARNAGFPAMIAAAKAAS